MFALSMNYLAYGAGFLVLYALVSLTISRKQREIVLNRLHIRRSRASGTFTPPRSLSPSKQGLPPNEPPKGPTYGDVFPPDRRSALAELKTSTKSSGNFAELARQSADYSKPLPNCENVFRDDLAQHITPTGFTVAEVQQLGDFPDYATLSGVPLPQPYREFDINKAMPRPFRPFRWSYHQTMCKSSD